MVAGSVLATSGFSTPRCSSAAMGTSSVSSKNTSKGRVRAKARHLRLASARDSALRSAPGAWASSASAAGAMAEEACMVSCAPRVRFSDLLGGPGGEAFLQRLALVGPEAHAELDGFLGVARRGRQVVQHLLVQLGEGRGVGRAIGDVLRVGGLVGGLHGVSDELHSRVLVRRALGDDPVVQVVDAAGP